MIWVETTLLFGAGLRVVNHRFLDLKPVLFLLIRAIYFYLLAPVYFLSNHSYFSSIYTISFFYLASFVVGSIYFWRDKKLLFSFLIAAFIITIHPQVIIQNRFVWNPSFVPPLIFLAYHSLFIVAKDWNKSALILYALSIGLALSLTYSIAPTFIAFSLLGLIIIKKPKRKLLFVLYSALGIMFWQLPTIVFEIRHNFFLTKLLINGEKLSQINLRLYDKLQILNSSILGGISNIYTIVFFIILLLAIGISFATLDKVSRQHLKNSVFILLISLLITLIVPISVQAHYIFGILTISAILVSFLDSNLRPIPVLILTYIFLHPIFSGSYFAPTYRTVIESDLCAKKICNLHIDPIYVSVQSDLHPYHNGMEWQYMLAKNACIVKNLDALEDHAKKMIVIVDHSQYIHGSTQYNELTQFGESKETSRFTCQDYLEVVTLEKK